MTKEEKQLLLKDLCARLPYRCFIHYRWSNKSNIVDEDRELDFSDVETLKYIIENPQSLQCSISWKPYLRPMSSMTDEEKKDLENTVFIDYPDGKIDEDGDYELSCEFDMSYVYVDICQSYADWLNEHHFDYRGLIEKSLAIVAPEGMYD